jgi:phage-related protein
MPIITAVTNWVKQNWSTIAMVTKTTWDLITSILQVAFAGILGIFGILLGLLTGDWKAAWNIINKAGDVGIAGIKNLLTSALNFIGGWGGMLFDELTRPFRQAWDTISGLVNKIKDALDFTKRHSPSVVDIVQKGVKLVNDSLSDLDMPISGLNTSIAPSFTSLGGGGAGNAFNSIQIDLSNAVISDEAGAMRMGEMVGDAIIRKLNSNIRH